MKILILADGKVPIIRIDGIDRAIGIETGSSASLLWDAAEPDPIIHPTGFPDWDYFKQIKVVSLLNNGTEEAILADYNSPIVDVTGTTGQIMAKFPRLYYKETYNVAGWLTGFELSTAPAPGLELHPLFTWGNGRSHIYIGTYEATEPTTGILSSVAGLIPRTSINMAAFRDRAVARGGGNQATSPWHQYSYWHEHFINMLFYVYYGNLDSQTALPGFTHGTWDDRRNTGRSNILTTMNGSVPADFAGEDAALVGRINAANETIANRFLFVENIFGHVWKFLDGVAFDGRVGQRKTAWMAHDPRIFTSVDATILSTYTDMDVDLLSVYSTSYVKATGKALLPVEGGAGTTTYYSDSMYSYLTDAANRNYLRVVLAGGALTDGATAGVACRYAYHGLSIAHAFFGSRLCFSEI